MPALSKKSQSSSNRKKYYLQLRGRGVIGLALVIFGISGWMFWLGLQVGRENAPVRFDMERIEQELASLKEAVIKEKQKLFNPSGVASADRPELKFYEILKGSDPTSDAVQLPAEAVAQKPEPPVISKAFSQTSAAEKPSTKPAQQQVAIKQAPPAPGSSAEKPYTIQVASLRNTEDANQLVERLRKKGYSAYQTAIELPGKGRWHRVRIGSFKDRADAQNTMGRLKSDQFQPMLVKQ